jgi:uncharacterized membrane protein YkvA (DUF1232 family)
MKTASRIKTAATVASVVRAATRPGAPSIPERVQAVPRLVRSTVEGAYAGTTLKRLGLVAAAVVYVASPVDLLPEAILPVIGAADDAVVLSWAIKAFFEETERFIAWEIGQGLHRPGPRRRPAEASSDASRTTVPGVPVGGQHDSSAPLRSGGVGDAPRRDRDTTGAAAPGRIASQVTRVAGGSRSKPGAGSPSASTAPGASARSDRASDRQERMRLPEGMRQAATDYVLESVRKRLER